MIRLLCMLGIVLVAKSSFAEELVITGQTQVPERAVVQLQAEFTHDNGWSLVTNEANWSISPGIAAQVSATGLVTTGGITADAFETVQCTYEWNGVLSSASFVLKVLNSALDDRDVLVDAGWGSGTTYSTFRTAGVCIGTDNQPMLLYAFSKSGIAEVNFARRNDAGQWNVQQVIYYRYEQGTDIGTALNALLGPVLQDGQPAFVVGLSSRTARSLPWENTLIYFRYDGQAWQQEQISTSVSTAQRLISDQQGQITVLSSTGTCSASQCTYGVRRYRRAANGWSADEWNIQTDADARYTLGLTRAGEVGYVRGMWGNTESYRGSLSDPNVVEESHVSPDGAVLPYFGYLAYDFQDRTHQLIADTQLGISAVRPTPGGYVREVVDDFGWGHSGSEKIVFDPNGRAFAVYGISAVGQTSPGFYTSLWDEIRIASVVNGQWVPQRIAGGGTSYHSLIPAFDSAGNLHLGFVHGGVRYAMFTASERLLTGGDFNDPQAFSCQFNLVNQSSQNAAAIVSEKSDGFMLQLTSSDSVPFGISQAITISNRLTIACQYRLDSGTNAKLAFKIAGSQLAEIPISAPADGQWSVYRRVFDLKEMNINPQAPYIFQMLASGSGGLNLKVEQLDVLIGGNLQPGDYDGDGAVDQSDYGHLQICYSGRNVPQTDPACADARLDSDLDVDMDDLALFRDCTSGAGVLSNRACTGY